MLLLKDLTIKKALVENNKQQPPSKVDTSLEIKKRKTSVGLEVVFRYLAAYHPNVGKIMLEGRALFEGDGEESEIKQIIHVNVGLQVLMLSGMFRMSPPFVPPPLKE